MRGPKGQWRPAGAGALAAHICKIATGESKRPTSRRWLQRKTQQQASRPAPEAGHAPRSSHPNAEGKSPRRQPPLAGTETQAKSGRFSSHWGQATVSEW